MTFNNDDFVPVTGGSDLHSNYLRSGTCALQDLKVTTDIDRHLVRLLQNLIPTTPHPQPFSPDDRGEGSKNPFGCVD